MTKVNNEVILMGYDSVTGQSSIIKTVSNRASIISGAAGVSRTRFVTVAHATLPVVATSGVIAFASRARDPIIQSLFLSAGVLPLTTNNWTIRYSIDPANDAADALLLPVTFPSGSATAENMQIGSFNVMPIVYPNTLDANRLIQIVLPSTIKIPTTSGILRMGFAHNLGAGVSIVLGVSAVEEL